LHRFLFVLLCTIMSEIVQTEVKAMKSVVSVKISEARSILGKVIQRVYNEEDSVVIEKSGIPVAALVSMADFKRLRKYDSDIFDNSLMSFADEWNHPSNDAYDNL